MAKTKSTNRRIDAAALRRRIFSAQQSAWRARSLAQAIQMVHDSGELDDPEAAMAGLVDTLDRLHVQMDCNTLIHGAPGASQSEEVANG